MTNVRRPIHLQLRPTTAASLTTTTTTPTCSNHQIINNNKPLSPTSDSLPSQIIPHLFVGNQEQTNKETLNRLNISYILSLGLLPLISNSGSPTTPTTNVTTSQQQNYNSYDSTNKQTNILLPSQNSSKDFKIRLKTTPTTTIVVDHTIQLTNSTARSKLLPQQQLISSINNRDENKGIKTIRSINCKCINISDNSDQCLSKFFDEAHQFIDEARRKKCNILVHCLAGISRSPTIAIAYLMRVNSLRLQDAYNLVKQCRPQIDPNLSFMGQLMIYEKSLKENDRKPTSLESNNIC